MLSVCSDPADPVHYVWAGTKEGLNKINKASGICTHYTIKNGLPNDVVYAVQPDAHNNLWLSTNNGLCLFNPATLACRNFTIDDGLPHNEFNRYMYAHDSTGRLYFGGINAWVGFDPEKFYRALPPSKVVINRLELDNKEISYNHSGNEKRGPSLATPVELCKELTLGPGTRVITIGFTAIEHNNAKKCRYRYMLENFSQDWVEAGSRNEATFTNIDPGTYTFKVLACNSDNIWSTEPALLRIIITPPWWATWWFRLAVAISCVTLVYAIYRYRVKQLLKVERLRNTIALNLHDDIGSSLSSISLYAAVLKKKALGLSEESSGLVDKMISNTSEIMENMNDIVWATKEDMSSFETVINRMRNFAIELTELAGIKLTFSTDNASEQLALGMQQRKNIYMFYKEALNNAVKHSDCNVLTVNIVTIGKRLEITIADNGKGFIHPDIAEDTDTGKGGSGLGSMRYRAEQIAATFSLQTSPGKGVTLKLSIPLK